jgi:hypothetical protein
LIDLDIDTRLKQSSTVKYLEGIKKTETLDIPYINRFSVRPLSHSRLLSAMNRDETVQLNSEIDRIKEQFYQDANSKIWVSFFP